MSADTVGRGPYVLAIDQGTTSTRCILFDAEARQVAVAQQEFRQIYPRPGWVEHDPEEIWRDTVKTLKEVLETAHVKAGDVAAIGVTNQRETVVVWDRKSGKLVHNAIVWQDRRTADACAALKAQGKEETVTAKTGLILDPYFSGTKLAWILDNVDGARASAERGELAFGTIDCFLLWRLTGGKVHATDPTNAGRTLLFNIVTQDWDDELLDLLNVPRSMLSEVKDNSGEFGKLDESILGHAIPIAGMAGDQQAALFGQACFREGMTKSTYGTGCFLLMNIGDQFRVSKNRMLTTPAYRLKGKTTYAFEGSIFVAGAAVKWLRDAMGLIEKAAETQSLAESLPDDHGVYMVPGFVGLGAPHWDPNARGLISGLTLDSSAAHLARAALEAVAYQTLDLTEAMAKDSGGPGATALRVDGGMSANDWMCQFLADILQAPVERPTGVETTAMGAAFLAGLAVGVWEDLDAVAKTWALDHRFEPKMAQEQRKTLVAGWNVAMKRALLS